MLATALQGLHDIITGSTASDDEGRILVLAASVPGARIGDYSRTPISELDHVLVLVESCWNHLLRCVTPEGALLVGLVAIEGKTI